MSSLSKFVISCGFQSWVQVTMRDGMVFSIFYFKRLDSKFVVKCKGDDEGKRGFGRLSKVSQVVL